MAVKGKKKRRKNQSFMPPKNLSPFKNRRLSKTPKKMSPSLFGIPKG